MKRRLSVALFLPILLTALLTSGCKASTKATNTGANGAAVTTTNATAGTGSGPTPAASAGATDSAGSGSTDCPTSNTTAFAKTKFVLHSGLAFGAFHRYIYKPLRAGSFQSGSSGRVKTFIKAGLAALFVKREVRLAYEDVKANPTLCKVIAAPLQAVGDKISGAVTALKGGDPSAVTAVESTVQGVESKASSAGTTIQEDANAPLG